MSEKATEAEERPSPSFEGPDEIARAWQAPIATRALTAVSIVYFASIWLDAMDSNVHKVLLPDTVTYFTQVAGLFPNAAVAIIDYRVEGWDCATDSWKEIDPRPDFPMDADTKENRFYRVLHFFRQTRPVMRALDEFVVERHNARAREGSDEVGVIGGIRTQSIRIPLPEPGQKIERYERRPASSYPETEHHYWYWTPKSRRSERCGHPAPSSGD